MKGYFPEPYNNSIGVKRILTCDWLSRKDKNWPLVPYHLISRYQTRPEWLDPHQSIVDVPYSTPETPLVAPLAEEISAQLYNEFPCLKVILAKYYGKVAVCGGALCRLYCNQIIPWTSDCDLFFYGYEGPMTQAVQAEYRAILEDCVAIISSFEDIEGDVYVEKTDNVIDVHREGCDEKYQFILRIYPRIDMILGGFDIGAAMIAFDGVNLFTTQLGAWSLAKRAIIVDTTRRSSSYERRLGKYVNGIGFCLVLPGFNKETTHPDISLNNHFYVIIEGWNVTLSYTHPPCFKRLKFPKDESKLSDYGTSFDLIRLYSNQSNG